MLESQYTETLNSLNNTIGEENINEGTPELIHNNTVDNVIDFEQKQIEHYQELLEMKNQLESENLSAQVSGEETEQSADSPGQDTGSQDRTPQKKNKLSAREVAKKFDEAALKATTVGHFRSELESINDDVIQSAGRYDDSAQNLAYDALRRINKITPGYESYNVEKDLSRGGSSLLGLAEVGGSSVTINADHLTDVITDEGAQDLHETMAHEEVHTKQTKNLHEGSGDVVVVDPKTGEKISSSMIIEGGAEKAMADKFRGGAAGNLVKSGSTDADSYRKGFQLYQDYGKDVLNAHVEQSGAYAGDAAHLQSEMIKAAGIDDAEKIVDIAKKAGFNKQGTDRILSQVDVKQPVEQGESTDSGSLKKRTA